MEEKNEPLSDETPPIPLIMTDSRCTEIVKYYQGKNLTVAQGDQIFCWANTIYFAARPAGN